MLSNCSPFTGLAAAAYSWWWWWGPPQDSWGCCCSWSPGGILGWQAMLMSHITLVIPFTLKHTVQRDLPSVEDASGDLSNRWGCPSGTDVSRIPSCESRPSFLCLCYRQLSSLVGSISPPIQCFNSGENMECSVSELGLPGSWTGKHGAN